MARGMTAISTKRCSKGEATAVHSAQPARTFACDESGSTAWSPKTGPSL